MMSENLKAALDWIQQAHHAASDGGISKGYDLLRRRWAPSYPETTGYTVPTLLNVAQILGRSDVYDLAISLADYLLQCATPEGGVVHWQAGDSGRPIVFDTGQVMFGWIAAFDATRNRVYLEAAQRAGNWLISIQNSDGFWDRNQYHDKIKVIDTRVAWSLLELQERTGEDHYRRAAVINLEWAFSQQNALGWFKNCAFEENQDPITHTLAYTAEGLLESGIRLSETKFIESARKMLDALLALQRSDGALASTYGAHWQETSRSSCLTGNCQIARLWLLFYREGGDRKYLQAAKRAIQFVADRQNLTSRTPGIRGGIAGSAPIFGHYERFQYPNWAAKFFIDAIISRDSIESDIARLPFFG